MAAYARKSLEKDGWTLYHSGGGIVVWAKATTAGYMYLGSDVDEADLLKINDPCGISIMHESGECVVSNMEFKSVKDAIAAKINLDGDKVYVERAADRVEGIMSCNVCSSRTTCTNCRDRNRKNN